MDAVEGSSVIGCGECEITGMNDAKAENTSESHDTLLMKADSERTPEMSDNYGNPHGSRDRPKIYGAPHLEDSKDNNGLNLIDKMTETCKEIDAQTSCDTIPMFDGKSLQELVKGFERHLQSTQRDRLTVPGRRWLGSDTFHAVGALLTDKTRRYWLGPTRGHTGMDRVYHRHQKACINSKIFRYTLAYIVHGQTCSDTQLHMRVLKRLTATRCVRTGGGHDQEESLFAQYVARLEQLPREEIEGHTRYIPKHRTDFEKMSRRRQLFEFNKLGMALDSLDAANKLFVRDDSQYPETHTAYEVPQMIPATMTTADILHHRYHLVAKIARLRRLRRESKREATLALRRRRRNSACSNGHDISIGSQRARNIYLISRSLTEHARLIQQLTVQLRKRIQCHNKTQDVRYVSDEVVMSDAASLTERPPARTRRRRGCRRHTKPKSVVIDSVTDDDGSETDTSEQPTFLQEFRRLRLRKWEARSNKVHYRSAQDRVGGYVTKSLENQPVDEGTISVCTMNMRGFDDDDNKIEFVLQFMQDEAIDIMICTDSQLDEKKGHWYGKIAKRRLGVGTRTNVNPCMVDHGDGNTGFKRVGGIFTIVGPKWGTSLVNFQKDKFGNEDGSAGVMSQVTLSTTTAKLNIIGTYWPNRNISTDTTLWNTLNRYVRKHRLRDKTPIELLQRVSQQWIATAYKNGSRGSILCGDLNATWTGAEAGGQTLLQQWADSFTLQNGIRQVAQRLHCEMYTRGGDGQPRTWIDHVLHKGMTENIKCLAGYTSQAAEWEGLSDHKPIWGVYKVHSPLQQSPKSAKVQKVRYELHLTDKQKCDEFLEAMETLLELPAPNDNNTDDEVVAYMHKIEQHSATTVKHLYNTHGHRQRSSRKNGWSPMYIAYKAHLTALVEIRRSILGHANRVKWTDDQSMLLDLPDVLEMWEATLEGLDISDNQRLEVTNATPHPLRWWKDITAIPQIELIDDNIERLKKLLHGTARTEMRRRININIRKREDARREGKWKKVIGSLLGNLAGRRHQPGIDLDMITTDGVKIIGEPKEIHQTVTDKFDEWFDMPNECHGDLHIGNDWQRCRDSEEYFIRDTAHTGAPEDIRRLIHKAIANVPNQKSMHDEMKEVLQHPPSLPEFEEAIQRAKTNSSAGISGCSYNQLKRWPAELIQRVHYCLCRIWRAQCTPDAWTARWLVVIPKKQEEIPNVSNMRPLILVEAIRKLWCKLLLHRILTVWKKHNALHHYQHGFIRGRNTMTASMLFINSLEDAIENGQPLHTCTWDITKAFDSVSKNVMKLAWTRLGVPEDWVQWLVGMDENGTTTVRTPHSIGIWNNQGAAGLTRRTRKQRSRRVYDRFLCPGTVHQQESTDDQQEISGLGFHAIRGTGQGDVTSPTCWAAIFDILLTALHMDIQNQRTNQHVASDANQGYAAGETAYADDLLSCARTPEALQRKADIVSTFCLVMGLQLSTSKLRRFVMAHSGLEDGDNSTTIVHQYGAHETVDGPQWAANEIHASVDGTLEYLGGKYDMDGSASTVLEEIKKTATSHCAEIGNTAASAATKIKCSSMTTYAKIRYRSKLAPLNLTELDEVDRIFYKFHTKATKNMGSFPYDLLYQSAEYGGVGLQRFTDLSSIDKLSEMFRSLRRSDEVSLAMGGLLQRTARAHGHAVSQGYKYRYAPKRGHRLWIRSALEWLQRHNIHLWRGGISSSTELLSSAITLAIPGLTSQQQRSLTNQGLHLIGDLVDDRGGSRIWTVPNRMRWLLELLPETPTTDDGTLLWPGQFWQPYANAEGIRPAHVLEVIHVLDTQRVEVAIWRQSRRRGYHIQYTRDEKTVTVNIERIFSGTHTERWDQSGRTGNTCSFTRARLVPSPRATVHLPQITPTWVQQAVQFCDEQGPDYRPRIYTDGSYSERDHDIHSVFDADAVTKTASAGIAIVHDGEDWQDRPIYAIHVDHGADVGTRSAYTMEYLALAMAMRMQSDTLRATAVCTDSMAVLKRLRNSPTRLGQADESHRILLQSINTSLIDGATMPMWVPSHPERRKKDQMTWTLDDWGNHIADKIAGNSRRSLRSLHANIRWTRISAIDVINSLPRADEHYFGDAHGRPTALFGLMDHVHRIRLDRYLTARDSQRVGTPKWMDNTITFAAAVFNEQRGSAGQYAHTARIIWDKLWHGRNRAKRQDLTEDGRRAAALCHMCNAPDSQHHSFRWCNHSNVRAIRDETNQALQDYELQHQNWRPGDGTEDEHRLQLSFIRGVIHEYYTCQDAGRVWTGNWNSSMIMRLQTGCRAEHITRKQCRRLRILLHEMYAIISQGANSINDIRHSVGNAQEAHIRHVQRSPESVQRNGQRLIVDYLLNTRGRLGLDTCLQDLAHEEELEADGMNISIHSDDSVENNDHWEEDMDNDVRLDWLEYPTVAECLAINTAIDNAVHVNQCLTTVGKHDIRAISLQRLVTGQTIDAAIVDGYLHTLQERYTGVKCMGSSFFTKLYNPGGSHQHMPRDTFNMGYASHHFNNVDIHQYKLILIPVLVKRHWTLIAVDMEALQIRYLNPQGGGGATYLSIIKRWLANRWHRHCETEFPAEHWRCITSHDEYTPQQSDDTSCGVFTMIFSELLAQGKDVASFTSFMTHKARMYVAHKLMESYRSQLSNTLETQVVHGPRKGSSRGTRRVQSGPSARSTFSVATAAVNTTNGGDHYDDTGLVHRASVKKRKKQALTMDNAGTGGQGSLVTSEVNTVEHTELIGSVSTCGGDYSDIDSLKPGGWLTDNVINGYFQLLQQRSAGQGTNNAYISVHFYNRMYDPATENIRQHLTQNSDSARNIDGLTDMDELRAMHQHDAIFNYSHVYVPVPRAQHWGLLEIDNGTRTITYMDSLYDGGYHYARVMSDYLQQYQEEITGTCGRPWFLRHTINPNNKPLFSRTVCVPRQRNGNDCGVFVCLFADLLDRQQEIMNHREPDTGQIRDRIRCSLNMQIALDLTSSDIGLPIGVASEHGTIDTQGESRPSDGEDLTLTAEATINSKRRRTRSTSAPDLTSSDIVAREQIMTDTQDESIPLYGTDRTPMVDAAPGARRRSTRSTRHTGSMAELETPLDINYHRLTVRKANGMGWGLFATTAFAHNERVICTYAGKRITARQAKSIANKSRYIVELPGKSKLNYIDGFDPVTQMCYSAGPYANDGISWTGRRDLWNAELAIDDYDQGIFVLRPLRDIQAGEQIYVWYGPRYWCSDDHSVEQMAMAVITYGIDITTSTERMNSYGNWKKLKQYSALQERLKQHGYLPPAQMADIKSIRNIPDVLYGSIHDATDEELDLRTLPQAISHHRIKPVSVVNDVTSPGPSQHTIDINGDEDQLPPSPSFTTTVLPRFRVGSNPTVRRQALLGNRKVQAQSTSVNQSITRPVKRVYTKEDEEATSDMSKRRRLEDPDISAPDALDDTAITIRSDSQVTQTHDNINDTNIRSAKRTTKQAMLPESYWSKRTRMDSQSS